MQAFKPPFPFDKMLRCDFFEDHPECQRDRKLYLGRADPDFLEDRDHLFGRTGGFEFRDPLWILADEGCRGQGLEIPCGLLRRPKKQENQMAGLPID